MPCPFLCRNLTCLNPRCPLCCQNPNKRCPDSVHFASKYLEKNPLKSRCGANIRIEVVNSGTGEPAHPHLLQDVVLEVRFHLLACNVLDSPKLQHCLLCSCPWWTARSTDPEMRLERTLPRVSCLQHRPRQAARLTRYDLTVPTRRQCPTSSGPHE